MVKQGWRTLTYESLDENSRPKICYVFAVLEGAGLVCADTCQISALAVWAGRSRAETEESGTHATCEYSMAPV